MRPTVGRIVHIIESVELLDQPHLAAIITDVNSDGTIEATVFRPGQTSLGAFNAVKELQPGAIAADNMTSVWHWPEVV